MARKRRNVRRRRKQAAQPPRDDVLQRDNRGDSARTATPALSLGAHWDSRIGYVLLAALVAACFYPAIYAGFVWDDVVLQKALPLQTPGGLWQIWFAPRSLTDFEGHYWPLLYTLFWLENRLWGVAPLGYHLVNLVIHAAVCMMVWCTFRRLEVPGAWFAAAVFAVHPVHVESVVWVIGRKDMLATLFYLSAVLAYLRFLSAHRARDYAIMLGCFVLGLLCKSIMLSLPIALLLWHWWKHGRITQLDWRRIAPLFAVGVGIAVPDLLFYKDRDPTAFDFNLLERALLAAKSLGFYAGKLILPINLSVIYPRWQISLADWSGWANAAGIIAMLGGLWMMRERIGRGALAGLLFFVATLMPSIGWVDFGYMLYSFVADRYQYLAGLGLLGAFIGTITIGIRRLAMRARMPVMIGGGVAGAAVLAVLATITWQQTWIYQNNMIFYEHVISLNPTARFAHHSLGQEYHERKRYDDAMRVYRIDLQLAPHGPSPEIRLAKNHIGLGATLDELGQTAEAENHFIKAVQLRPRYDNALDNLGGFYIRHRRYGDALPLFQQLLTMKPNHPRFHVGRGVSLSGLGRNEEALRSYERALALQPGMDIARINRERLLKYLEQKRAAQGGQTQSPSQ